MYPLNAILIGCDEDVLPHVRRELDNRFAHIEAEFVGVAEAVANLRSSQAQKRLLIVHLKSAGELDGLRRLRTLFAGWPIVALMDAGGETTVFHNSIYIAAMRSGATQIIPLPIQAEDFEAALECVLTQFVYSDRQTKVVAVAGVTGGCGSTTIAINLAYEIAFLRNIRCILADLSLKMGMVANYLNVDPEHSIHDLLEDVRRVDTYLMQKVLIRVAENLDVLAGPHHAIRQVTPSPRDVLQVVDIARRMANVVVLDLPCTYDDLYFDVLAQADHVVLVAEQKVPSIRALKLVRETLGRSRDMAADSLVIDRYDPKVPGFSVKHLTRPLEVADLLTVADDPNVVAASNRGCPLRLEAPQSRALTDIDALVDTLLACDDRPQPKLSTRGVFGRLARVLGHP